MRPGLLDLLPEGDVFTAQAYAVRALARADLGDYDGAIDDYSAAIRLVPKAAGLRINRGLMHARLGQYDRAEADYRAALPLDGGTATAL